MVVVPYDPAWVAAFEAERARMAKTLFPIALGIEHIGSTSVPGLCAKPVIDLLVGTLSLEDADRCVPLLVAEGWDFSADFNATLVGRRFLRRLQGGVRTHHVHIVVFDGELWEGYLRFRDKLREQPELAREYETLKRDLAVKFRDERERYTASKTDFVKRVLE